MFIFTTDENTISFIFYAYIIHRIIVILFLISNFFVVYMSNKIFTHSLPMRYADFPTLVDALDYAALSSAGMNFYDRRCQLEDQLEYQTLKTRAEAGAKRLLSLNLKKGERVALIAETSSGFVEAFFCLSVCCLVAVPLAIPMASVSGIPGAPNSRVYWQVASRSHYHW